MGQILFLIVIVFFCSDSGFSGTEDVVSKASPMQADCDDGEPDGTNSASEAPLSSSLEAEYRLAVCIFYSRRKKTSSRCCCVSL